MNSRERLASALRELGARGFTSAGNRRGERQFRGNFRTSRERLEVQLGVKDWEFLEYPSIQVLGGLDRFPQLRPHLDRNGDLCYFARRSVILDKYDPATALAQCLEQAEAVLEKILTDRAYVKEDIQNEFLIHWAIQAPSAMRVCLVQVSAGLTSVPLLFPEKSMFPALISEDLSAAQAVCDAAGWGPINRSGNRCWLLQSAEHPPVPAAFAKNVSQLFQWLREWDIRMYHALQHVLGRDEAYEFELLPVAVKTPLGWMGFMLRMQKAGSGSASQRKQRIHAQAESIPIQRLSIEDVSPQFVHSRNLTFKDLSGKMITLVGCGAIGSQLAAALVRMGAGSGTGGLMRLIDEESLQPENLGRHYLGYSRLFEPKADSMRRELLQQFPLARIEALNFSAQKADALFAADLLIEATGDEAVSEYINGRWLEARRPCEVLYVWIKGNGECVQSLWTRQPEYACFRCLRTNEPDTHRQERFAVLKRPPQRKTLGCHAFTPYAISAPLNAAGLAIDAICDWLAGNPSPRFRNRCREGADVHAIGSTDAQRLDDCPACSLTR